MRVGHGSLLGWPSSGSGAASAPGTDGTLNICFKFNGGVSGCMMNWIKWDPVQVWYWSNATVWCKFYLQVVHCRFCGAQRWVKTKRITPSQDGVCGLYAGP